MKALLISLLTFFVAFNGNAQIFKKLGEKLKGDAEWRLRNKADNEVRKGLDSLFNAPKKIKEKKKEKQKNSADSSNNNNNNTPNNQNQKSTGNVSATASNDNDVQQKDGLITLQLSGDKAYTGFGIRLGIRITGESVKYKNYNQVQVVITGPSTNEIKQVPLSADGKFIMDWSPTEETGDFTVTATSSDKKASKKQTFSVEALDAPDYDNWPEKNIGETKKAEEKLKEAVENAEGGISPKDKEELEKKMDEVKENVKDLYKLFKDLNKANKEAFQLIKKDKKVPPNFSANLSELNNILNDQASQMKQVNDIANHKPSDNSICEYLVMVNEACAAFSTFTNIWSKSIGTIIKNIVIDKGVPTTVGTMTNNRLPPDIEFSGKESAKIFATSLFDAESLSTKLGKAGIAGDIVQFGTDVLMKKYCGVFKGNFKHDYTIEYRNSKGQNWWTYGVKMGAALNLRYPKEGSSGNIIKMKGNLEGNATKFTFFQDLEKEDDFNRGSIANFKVIPIKTFIPLAVSVATSERDVMGFGAIARGLATPAYFNIRVDAEYNVDEGKIKLFINDAIIDFTDLVATQFVFLMIGVDGLPYIKKMNFPIHKAKTTIGGVVSANNKFEVEKDSKGNLSFKGKYNKHIGNKSTERETDLNFSIDAQKQ